MSKSHLHIWDFVAIACYFSAVIGTGLYAMCKNKRDTVKGYFLAGRFMTWLPVGASLFASNIGSEHFIGLAGSGAASGIAVGAFELNACFFLQLLGWVFLPVYIATGVCTLPEYMNKQFGGQRIRVYLAVLSLCLYVFTKISVNLYSGALFIQQAFNWNLYISVLLLLSITALTTVTGGLAAVIYTDTLQTMVMISGAIILTILGFVKVGGYSNLYHKYLQAVAPSSPYYQASPPYHSNNHSLINDTISDVIASTLTHLSSSLVPNTSSTTSFFQQLDTPYDTSTSHLLFNTTVGAYDYTDPTNMAKCGYPRPDSWYMLRDPTDKHMPWPGFLLGQTTASIWYWCADQIIVQRTLASKSLSHAQGSTLMAGFLKMLPVFILVLPGMISRVLFTGEVACNDPEVCMRVCQNPLGCSNIAFPKLVLEIMPVGLKGIMMSVMLAALIGELTSIFNSASTLFTMDVYKTFRKKTKTRELMIVGRVFVCVMVVFSILWIPIVQSMHGAQLYIYIQSVSAYLAPPIAAVYLLSILWKRTSEKGAFSGLMVGLVLGAVRMACNFMYHEPGCGESDERPWILLQVHYMYYAFFLFVVTLVVVLLVSMLSAEADPPGRVTYWTSFDGVKDYKEAFDDAIGLKPIRNDHESNGHLVYPVCEEKSAISYINCDRECNTYEVEVTEVCVEKSSKWRKFFDWFCGMSVEKDDEETAHDSKTKAETGLESSQMMEQTPREKFILRSFLCLLLFTTLLLYVFFSTGSDLGLLRK